ncbi:MAG: HIT domain-containing protein [Desulfobacterales bacterium]|nr:HIT domain-containing protein [Desulfobacterales bacterium]
MINDCIFCRIIQGEAPAEFMYQNDSLVVFKDIRPHAPVHLLIVPKKHIRSINNLDAKDGGIVSEMILAGKLMAKRTEIAESGYKLLFNVERGGGQVIFHLHLHLLGGWK